MSDLVHILKLTYALILDTQKITIKSSDSITYFTFSNLMFFSPLTLTSWNTILFWPFWPGIMTKSFTFNGSIGGRSISGIPVGEKKEIKIKKSINIPTEREILNCFNAYLSPYVLSQHRKTELSIC